MNLYTIGFTQKSAAQFFELIKENNIELLIDIRLNNKSQLAGFAKGEDLRYFLNHICNCEYIHELMFAPSKELLDNYRDSQISWKQYEEKFNELISSREMRSRFDNLSRGFSRICLLCSEANSEKCHRRLLAENIGRYNADIKVIHL